jgi:hypothetical protein
LIDCLFELIDCLSYDWLIVWVDRLFEFWLFELIDCLSWSIVCLSFDWLSWLIDWVDWLIVWIDELIDWFKLIYWKDWTYNYFRLQSDHCSWSLRISISAENFRVKHFTIFWIT